MAKIPRFPAVHVINKGWETDSFDLAAALLSVGIPLNPHFPCERYEGDVNRDTRLAFFFEDASPCGKFHTRELVAAWADLANFIRQFPEHPFAYAATAVQNRARLLYHAKNRVPQVVVRKGGKLAVIRADAPQVEADKILAYLNK
jgi:hypothetical protein